MGSILKALCSKCGYQTELFIGGGLADCERETAIAAVHNDKEAAAVKESEWFQIKRSAAFCVRCKKLVVATDVTYQQTENGQEMHVWGGCPDCSGLITLIPQDAREVPCPKCGESLTLDLVGRWD